MESYIRGLCEKNIFKVEEIVKQEEDQKIWYHIPAESWTEALPVGNGRLGGMVYGGVNREVIQLNEDSIWAGYGMDKNNPRAKEALPEIRKLLFEGKNLEASKIAKETVISVPERVFSYETMGEMVIESLHSRRYTKYKRELDLSTAMTTVTFSEEGILYRREVFVSYPDQVMVIHYTCDQPGGIRSRILLKRLHGAWAEEEADDMIRMEGYGHKEGSYCRLSEVVQSFLH